MSDGGRLTQVDFEEVHIDLTGDTPVVAVGGGAPRGELAHLLEILAPGIEDRPDAQRLLGVRRR